ncbi:hypothetical protein F2Q68_00016054 [Brassica cretica]|uniref:Uncharacterized protein n=1 Tax=Brassica cretica TaxID=69181 RepID=A0A8S9HLS1_BRACR|nr:hypothetical protein F2Q68_00016054 [Brassica cretica]
MGDESGSPGLDIFIRFLVIEKWWPLAFSPPPRFSTLKLDFNGFQFRMARGVIRSLSDSVHGFVRWFLITTMQVGSLLNLLSSFLRRACPGVRSHDVHMYGFLGPFVIP